MTPTHTRRFRLSMFGALYVFQGAAKIPSRHLECALF